MEVFCALDTRPKYHQVVAAGYIRNQLVRDQYEKASFYSPELWDAVAVRRSSDRVSPSWHSHVCRGVHCPHPSGQRCWSWGHAVNWVSCSLCPSPFAPSSRAASSHTDSRAQRIRVACPRPGTSSGGIPGTCAACTCPFRRHARIYSNRPHFWSHCAGRSLCSPRRWVHCNDSPMPDPRRPGTAPPAVAALDPSCSSSHRSPRLPSNRLGCLKATDHRALQKSKKKKTD